MLKSNQRDGALRPQRQNLFFDRRADDEHFVFINVFYKDIDRPYLDNHIFILYEIKACTETVSSYLKIKKLKQYHSSYNFVYNNRTFMVAIFTIPLKYKKDYNGHHPTQKPVLLLEDLIKTFSNENDLVVDLTMGSGSTGVACKNTNRNFIGIEKDENYFKIAEQRINARTLFS